MRSKIRPVIHLSSIGGDLRGFQLLKQGRAAGECFWRSSISQRGSLTWERGAGHIDPDAPRKAKDTLIGMRLVTPAMRSVLRMSVKMARLRRFASSDLWLPGAERGCDLAGATVARDRTRLRKTQVGSELVGEPEQQLDALIVRADPVGGPQRHPRAIAPAADGR